MRFGRWSDSGQQPAVISAHLSHWSLLKADCRCPLVGRNSCIAWLVVWTLLSNPLWCESETCFNLIGEHLLAEHWGSLELLFASSLPVKLVYTSIILDRIFCGLSYLGGKYSREQSFTCSSFWRPLYPSAVAARWGVCNLERLFYPILLLPRWPNEMERNCREICKFALWYVWELSSGLRKCCSGVLLSS